MLGVEHEPNGAECVVGGKVGGIVFFFFMFYCGSCCVVCYMQISLKRGKKKKVN